MTKKDYELIARWLKYTMYDDGQVNTELEVAGIEQVCENLAIAFEQNNPKFNRSKFLKACGLEA